MKSQSEDTVPRRRHHDRALKADLVEQSLAPGASVSAIALKAGINANLLFKWRRDHVAALGVAASTATTLLPVCVIPEPNKSPTVQPSPASSSAARAARTGTIDLEFAGAQLRLRGGVDEEMLSAVLRALRQST
ncbi:MAG: transposase [Burkholderiales bacterium]|nr:transposase [Burkholderiales bacterium]